MQKKIIFILLIFCLSLSIFSAEIQDIDNYLREYSSITYQMSLLLKQIRSNQDFERFSINLQELIKRNAINMQSLNIKKEDVAAISQRYAYHIKNNTSLGQGLKATNMAFYIEYRRIAFIPGGQEFLQRAFKQTAVPTQ